MAAGPSRPLEGKTALVTGGGRRLGRAISLALGGAGAAVVVHYNRSAAEAAEVCDELEAIGARCHSLRAELSRSDGLEDLVAQAWDWSGAVDVLVNNASIFPTGRLTDMTFESVTANMAVNAWAPFALTRALWERAEAAERGGAVVNLLDSRLVGGDPLHAAYFVSKSALAQLTEASALEFAPALRVNAVAPGPILPPEDKTKEYLRQQLDRLPLQRWGGTGAIAEAVLYLATADFVTGQTIFVDGGQHLRPWGRA
jgi:NAD(P)-dependent dehydrogenase (short-subunit alcohol dehydrogenase family)